VDLMVLKRKNLLCSNDNNTICEKVEKERKEGNAARAVATAS
jgi:hypothetical protein